MLAHLLATVEDDGLRDGSKALKLAKKVASRPGYNGVRSLTVLAEVYAELGDYNTAIRTAQDAYKKAEEAGKTDAADLLHEGLRLPLGPLALGQYHVLGVGRGA